MEDKELLALIKTKKLEYLKQIKADLEANDYEKLRQIVEDTIMVSINNKIDDYLVKYDSLLSKDKLLRLDSKEILDQINSLLLR